MMNSIDYFQEPLLVSLLICASILACTDKKKKKALPQESIVGKSIGQSSVL